MSELEVIKNQNEQILNLLHEKVVLEPALTPEQIASHYGLETNTVRSLIRSGKIQAFKFGGRNLYVRQSELRDAEDRGMLKKPERTYKPRKK